MKRAFTMLGVIGVTALITFLWVTKNQSEERASQLDKRLAEAEARTAMLEGDIDTANQRLKYLSEHSRPQTTPVARQVKTSAVVPGGTFGEPVGAINLVTATSNTHETTVQPLPLPVPFGAAGGTAGYQFGGASGSWVRIEGTSSIQDWRVESAFIGGSGLINPGLAITGDDNSDLETTNATVTAFIPVLSLRSVDQYRNPFSERMDQIMHDKLRARAHPQIIFAVESLKPTGNSKDGNATSVFNARGRLAIAGVTNTIKLSLSGRQLADGKMEFSGVTRLKMSDFKIDPPSLSLGVTAIKAGDDVTVTFIWKVKATTPLQARSGP